MKKPFVNWQSFCPFWPDEYAELYRSKAWANETFFDFLKDLSGIYKNKTAIIDSSRSLNYTELFENALSLAHGLFRLGLRRGDRVVVQLPNCAEFVELSFALYRLGVVPVLALPAHRDLEIGQFTQFVQARACFIAPETAGFDLIAMAERIQSANQCLEHIIALGDTQRHVPFADLYESAQGDGADIPSPMPEDVACFQISGGTTGVPKLIPRRHMEYIYNVHMAAKASGFSDSTRYLCALPIAHNFPMACPGFMGALSTGGTTIIADDPGPETCFALIEKHGVTATSLVPPIALLWHEAASQSDADLSSLEVLQVGGAKLNASAAKRIGPGLGCKLQQVLGMAEGLICYTALDDTDERIYSTQGAPMSPLDEVRVVRPDGTDAANGETGELLVRGPYTIRGYYNMEDHNVRAFTPDGFYCTGDIVSRDEDGYLTVEGRQKDQVNRGGEKIGVDEIEDFLQGHEKVVDVAVVGRPDSELGEKLCAFVVVKAGASISAARLKRHLHECGLASFKTPDDIIFIDTFPQTGVGKVNKRQLREMLKAKYFTTETQNSKGNVPA